MLEIKRQEVIYVLAPYSLGQPTPLSGKEKYPRRAGQRIPGVALGGPTCDWEEQRCFHNSAPYLAWGQHSSNG